MNLIHSILAVEADSSISSVESLRDRSHLTLDLREMKPRSNSVQGSNPLLQAAAAAAAASNGNKKTSNSTTTTTSSTVSLSSVVATAMAADSTVSPLSIPKELLDSILLSPDKFLSEFLHHSWEKIGTAILCFTTLGPRLDSNITPPPLLVGVRRLEALVSSSSYVFPCENVRESLAGFLELIDLDTRDYLRYALKLGRSTNTACWPSWQQQRAKHRAPSARILHRYDEVASLAEYPHVVWSASSAKDGNGG